MTTLTLPEAKPESIPGVKRVWSVSDVAAHFGVTRIAVNTWRRAGLLPASINAGSHFRYTEDDINKFIENRASLNAVAAAKAREAARMPG